MMEHYPKVITRFLRQNERLILSEETSMPLVIEAAEVNDASFLQAFLKQNSSQLLADVAKYGAVLFRGFSINTEKEFEETLLNIQGIHGISDAFMSEEGRIQVDGLNYVLHTNAVYKTGGTLYLGGFHSENYYSPDVPGYISFCCVKPSLYGGETGLINMSKVYEELPVSLKEKLKKNTFFVSRWLLSEAAERYQLSENEMETLCQHYDLPVVGTSPNKFILMYKPSVFKHPKTQLDALLINFFEVPGLNRALRKIFMSDYADSRWFWHRFVWQLPSSVFHVIKWFYIVCSSVFYSPKQAFTILLNKLKFQKAAFKSKLSHNEKRVGECFTESDVNELARLMRRFYCSSVWKKGDILLIDNKQVVHAGMPGKGPRLIRAIIANPLEISCEFKPTGFVDNKERSNETLGYCATNFKSNFQVFTLNNDKSPNEK